MPRKQLEIPGTEAPSIPEVEKAADEYVKIRDKRMRLTEQEVTAKINLVQVLLEHEAELAPGEDGTKTYRYDDEIVILKPGKRIVKVKAVHDDEDEEDNEE